MAELRQSRIFVTGGTGFFGVHLLEGLLYAEQVLTLGLRLTVLTRNPEGFRARVPHLASSPALSIVAGDVRSFAFPSGEYSHVIHCAAESVRTAGTDDAAEFATIVDGTARVLEFARRSGASRLLYVSSGAVYGPQPPALALLGEEHACAPADTSYARGKLEAERLCLLSQQPRCVLARPFAFHGPHLPLHAHFAAGNFLRDALLGTPITIRSDGTSVRSYLYAVDLAVWIVSLLVRGEPGRVYNVGSEEAVSILDLAKLTASVVCPGLPVHVLGEAAADGRLPSRYVPSTERARLELGLCAHYGLEQMIRRTAAWHRGQQQFAAK